MSASNSVEQVACEDLKAFERRLTEIISSAQPSAIRWRLVLVIASVCVAVGAVYWLGDPKTAEVSFQVLRLNFPPQLLSLVQFFLHVASNVRGTTYLEETIGIRPSKF